MWFKFYTKYDSPNAAEYLESIGYCVELFNSWSVFYPNKYSWSVYPNKFRPVPIFRGNHHQLCKFAVKKGWIV